jgi:hypothetical protein
MVFSYGFSELLITFINHTSCQWTICYCLFKVIIFSIMNFSNGVSIAPGTYTEDDPGYDYTAAGVYNPNSTTIVWGAGLHYPSVKPLKITIATKTATEMSGTIEGAFYKQDVSTGQLYDDYTLFTECEFKLPVK